MYVIWSRLVVREGFTTAKATWPPDCIGLATDIQLASA